MKLKNNINVGGRPTKMSEHMGFQYPVDGLTSDEKQIEKLIGTMALHQIYGVLPNNKLKALVALHFELGYPQDVLAKIFGVDQSMISLEIDIVRKILLGKPYHPHKPKPTMIEPHYLLQILMVLQQE